MRANNSGLVDEVAGAIADGECIDWDEARRRSGDPAVARVVANLELIDGVGRRSRSTTSVSTVRPSIQPSLLVLILLVGLQVVVASIGFAVGAAGTTIAPGWLLLVSTLVFGTAGAVVAIAGRWDSRTAPLAGLFLVIASSTSLPLLALASRTGSPVWWIGAFVFESFFPYLLWRFVGEFPRVVRIERRGHWMALATRASLAVGTILFLLNALDRLRVGNGAIGGAVPFLLRGPTSGYWFLLLGLALPAPLVVFARLRHSSDDERRRAKLFVWGLAVGIVPMLVAVLAEVISPSWSMFMNIPRNRMIGSFVVYGFMLTIPLTLGYAAVARRVLDLRFVIGRAARAALARRTLQLLSMAPWLSLAAILWINRERSLSEIFRSPAVTALASIGLIGIVLFLSRDWLLARVEGALSGPHRNPSAVLASLAQRLSGVRDTLELNRAIDSHAGALLAAESSYLLIRSEADGAYLSPDPGCRPLGLDSALARLAESSPGPISTDGRDSDSWLPWLPESDRLWTADADIRLVLPVIDRAEETVALIAFGPSRSGWAHDDVHRDTASAIASAVSLTLARLESEDAVSLLPPGGSNDEPAGECLRCGTVSRSSHGDCVCGEALSPAAIPFCLAGKFRLERVLGRGGMGVVYLAKDLTLDRRVALKTLPRMRSGSLLRLRGEARSMASFVHPHLALIFGAETWRGVPVLVVEYLAGGTLSERISRANHPAFVVELGIKLAGALSALHDKGVLHRDVKPANIGFSERVEPKLLDFGLARIVQESQADFGTSLDLGSTSDRDRFGARLTRTDHVVGTPLYLSPEVLRGAPPSPRQDLWGLHVVLWETLVGHHPLHELPLDAALIRITDASIPSVSSARPDLPQPLVDVLDRGLNRSPAARPQSAASLQRDLESVLRSVT